MRVLVACEESQVVCTAFRNKGHEAYSCDVIDCSGGHPEWHIKDDVLKHLNDGWDMMLSFPPCTHLCVSGAAWFKQKQADGRQQQGIEFFMRMVNAPIHKIAIENPIGIMSRIYRKPDQIIQPYRFGDPFYKTTCLWLKNLPKLYATHHDAPLFGEKCLKEELHISKSGKKYTQIHLGCGAMYKKEEMAKLRSKTFPGIAEAMANQWY